MYWYIVGFSLISPLVGIYLVEGGHLSWSIGVIGYPNGASIAYLQYILVFSASSFGTIALIRLTSIAAKRQRTASKISKNVYTDRDFFTFAQRVLWVNIIFGIVFVFGFGSIKVVLGYVDKGSFRSTLGVLGFIPYLFTKTIIPVLLACLAILYLKSAKTKANKAILFWNFFIAFVVAMTWGFKTTGIALLLPAGIVFLWSANILIIMKYFIYGFSIIVGAFFVFDAGTNSNSTDVLNFLFIRATVLQGDVSWWVWDIYTTNGDFPPYFGTLLAALGDKFLVILGVTQNDLMVWMLHHYDWLINYVAGVSLGDTANGHSIVGTPFSEGLIMGGYVGMIVIASLAGSLVGLMYVNIRNAILLGKAIKGSLVTTYFCFYVFPWLVGGGLVQLFHISVIVGFFLSYAIVSQIVPRGYGQEPELLGH